MKWASLFSFLLRSKATQKHETSSAIELAKRSSETYTPKAQHVFISYARADDEKFVLKLYEDLVRNNVNVWWDRKAMESRGRTFLQEIRDAIQRSDRVLAVIGPMALKVRVRTVGVGTCNTVLQRSFTATSQGRLSKLKRS